MSQSKQAVLVLVFFVCLMTGIFSWGQSEPTRLTWAFRWGAGGTALIVLFLLLRSQCRKDGAPDFLKDEFGNYYERDGFCFVVGVLNEDGESVMRITFQNRYTGPCEAMVQIQPQRLRVRMPPMPALSIPVCCPGGAFGTCGMLWPIPADWQGETCLLRIAAASKYPDGRGKLLRYRGGMDVGKAGSASWDTAAALATLAMAGPAQALLGAAGTRIKVTLPESVATDAPAGRAVVTEILWTPDDAKEEA